MGNRQGFTLLEVLIIISVLSIILTLSVPFTKSLIDKQEKRQFIKLFKSDILYLQSLSLGSRKQKSKMEFHKTHYVIYQSRTKNPVIRSLPKDWKIVDTTYKSFYFINGTINKGGHIIIQTTNHPIEIIFPLGNGRGYIREAS